MLDGSSSELATGIETIDAEHRRMIDQIRDLVPRLKRGDEPLDSMLDALERHVALHFAHEEALLRQAGYPEVEQHAAEHEKLRRYLAERRQELRRHGPELLEVTCRLLAAAIATHIEQHDSRFVGFLAERLASTVD